MSKVCVAGFGLSLDGFSAGIEQSLSDPLGNRGRFGDRHCGCGGRVAGDRRSLALDWDSKLSIRMVAGFAEIAEKERFFGCGGPI